MQQGARRRSILDVQWQVVSKSSHRIRSLLSCAGEEGAERRGGVEGGGVEPRTRSPKFEVKRDRDEAIT